MRYSKEVVELAKAVKPILDKAWDYYGDVFGILHNDANDLSSLIDSIIESSKVDA